MVGIHTLRYTMVGIHTLRYTQGYTPLCTPRDIPPMYTPGIHHLPGYTPVYTTHHVPVCTMKGVVQEERAVLWAQFYD